MNWDEICQQRASNNHKTCSQPYRMNLYSLGCWFGCFSKLGLPFSTIGQIQMTCPLVMVPWNLPFKYFKKIVLLGCALWWFLFKTSGFSLSKFRTPNFQPLRRFTPQAREWFFLYGTTFQHEVGFSANRLSQKSNMCWINMSCNFVGCIPLHHHCIPNSRSASLLVSIGGLRGIWQHINDECPVVNYTNPFFQLKYV